MGRTLAFIHTSPVLVPMFTQLAQDYLPGLNTFHMVDESLIKNTIAAGELTKATTRRLVGMIDLAHDGGADAVMVTCSSIGRGVIAARQVFDFPIFRIDEAMAEAAVTTATRIGVAATLRTTLEPTVALLEETARDLGRSAEITPRLCDGAFDAVLQGNGELHDSLVREGLRELMSKVDVVVLAQASMARVIPSLNEKSVPILTSPELAVQRASELLRQQAAAAER